MLLVPVGAEAAERAVSDVVLVDEGAVIDDDLYAAGNRVVVNGRIDGDLIVAAYEDVTINGSVNGDVLGLAGSVIVNGTVRESVRVAAPTFRVPGTVEGDVVALSWSAALNGDLGGDAVLWGWTGRLAGSVSGDVEGQMRNFTLRGAVEGDLDVTVGRLRVGEGAVVGGDLGYRSRAEADVSEAEVAGAVVHRRPLPPNIRVRAFVALAKIGLGTIAAMAGLLVMWALPGLSERAMAGTATSWWRAWLRGLAALAVPVVVAVLAAFLLRLAPVEAALPLVGVLVPVFVAVVGVVLALSLLSPVAAFPWLGRLGNRGRGPVRAFLYGAILVLIVSFVPWAAWAVALFVVPLGMGGWLSLGPPVETS